MFICHSDEKKFQTIAINLNHQTTVIGQDQAALRKVTTNT